MIGSARKIGDHGSVKLISLISIKRAWYSSVSEWNLLWIIFWQLNSFSKLCAYLVKLCSIKNCNLWIKDSTTKCIWFLLFFTIWQKVKLDKICQLTIYVNGNIK